MTPISGPPPRPTIAFIGAGRAAHALAAATQAAGYSVVAVHSRTDAHARNLAKRLGAEVAVTALAAVGAADLTFLTVPDGAITSVAATIAASGVALPQRAVVHCSAGRGREAIASLRLTTARLGALHPLQALAGTASAALLRGSAITVEADAELMPTLQRLIEELGGIALTLPPGTRRIYHAAAVLAGNAPLALLAAAVELLTNAGLDRTTAERGLTALFAGAAANARQLGCAAALTGPVVRGDAATVADHLAALDSRPAVQAIYRRLAAETLRLAGGDGSGAMAALLAEPPAPPDEIKGGAGRVVRAA